MAYFDRFDICEAYAVLEWDWNMGGWLQERPTNRRRMEATSVQLARLGFKPRPNLSFETLTENGQEIYRDAEQRLRLTANEQESVCIEDFCGRDGTSGLPVTFSADYFPAESLTYFTGDWGAEIPPMPCPQEPTSAQAYDWARIHGGVW